MKPLVKTVSLEKIEYYTIHLQLVNCVLPIKLKPKEIEVLANFMGFREDEENERFNSNNRKIIRNRLNISHGGLSNYINSLRDKGVLIKTGKGITLLPVLQPDEKEQAYMFKIINIDNQ